MSLFALVLAASGAEQASVQQVQTAIAPADRATVQRIEREVASKFGVADPHAYTDDNKLGVDFAAGAEFGMGAVIPSLRSPAYVFNVRLGGSLHAGRWAVVLAGQSGINVAFNPGSSGPHYGYVVRVPLGVAAETIHSVLLNYSLRWYVNIHVGGAIGSDFLLAAQCQYGACEYVQPDSTLGYSLRVGASFSAQRRSGLGFFLTWHANNADCKTANGMACRQWLSSLVWSIGWTLF